MKTLSLMIGLALATTGATVQAEEPMTDLEIAHTAYTAGGLDIRYAHLALAISETEAVRDFAQTMIRDHSAVNEAAGTLIAELNVTPQDNPLSQALVEGAAAKRAELTGLTGADFDCAYATNELGYHRVVNQTVAETFLPAVTVEPLKALLEDALTTFRAIGLQAWPAPTDRQLVEPAVRGQWSFLPSHAAFARANRAWHEYVGMAYYRMRGWM